MFSLEFMHRFTNQNPVGFKITGHEAQRLRFKVDNNVTPPLGGVKDIFLVFHEGRNDMDLLSRLDPRWRRHRNLIGCLDTQRMFGSAMSKNINHRTAIALKYWRKIRWQELK